MLALLALAGCPAPAVEGYQLQAPPEGFLYAADQGGPPASSVPGLEAVGGGLWVGDITLDEPRTTVSVTRFRGPAGSEETASAREARATALNGSPHNRLGPLRTLAFADGHTASAWTEFRHDEYGRYRSLQVTALVSYDTVAFALEIDTSVPERMREPHLDSILATFGEGRTALNWVPLAAVGVTVGVLVALVGRRSTRRESTDYRMARVPKPKAPGDGKLVKPPPAP
jgi:hypothetical protein